jgi:hypothetical protein
MAREKSSASAHPTNCEVRRCEVCGVSSHEKSLVGIKNDRSKGGPRFCLLHHPDSMTSSVRSDSLVGAAAELSLSGRT